MSKIGAVDKILQSVSCRLKNCFGRARVGSRRAIVVLAVMIVMIDAAGFYVLARYGAAGPRCSNFGGTTVFWGTTPRGDPLIFSIEPHTTTVRQIWPEPRNQPMTASPEASSAVFPYTIPPYQFHGVSIAERAPVVAATYTLFHYGSPFGAGPSQRRDAVMLLDPSGVRRKELCNGNTAFMIAISPDGNKVVAIYPAGDGLGSVCSVYTIDQQFNVRATKTCRWPGLRGIGEVIFDHAGKRIAFHAGDQSCRSVYLADIEHLAPRQVSEAGASSRTPVFGPDDLTLTYCCLHGELRTYDTLEIATGKNRIFHVSDQVIRAQTSHALQSPRDSRGTTNGNIAVLPIQEQDSPQISDVWTAHTDGSHLTFLLSGKAVPPIRDAYMQFFSLDRTGRDLVLCASDGNEYTAIYHLDLQHRAPIERLARVPYNNVDVKQVVCNSPLTPTAP